MSKIKRELEARCEVLMITGNVFTSEDHTVIRPMVDYCVTTLTNGEVSEEVNNTLDDVFSKQEIAGFCLNKVQGMPCITLIIMDEETDYNPVFTGLSDNVGDNYQFCYVLNVQVPYFSEYGDCFFEKRPDGNIHRIS